MAEAVARKENSMTSTERREIAKSFEKVWHQSKKFLAFLLMELLLAAIITVALFKQPNLGWPLAAFMLGAVFTMGVIALTFNGYQAKLDMYVRAMTLIGHAGAPLNVKAALERPQTAENIANEAGQEGEI